MSARNTYAVIGAERGRCGHDHPTVDAARRCLKRYVLKNRPEGFFSNSYVIRSDGRIVHSNGRVARPGDRVSVLHFIQGPWSVLPPSRASGRGLCVGTKSIVTARVPGRRLRPRRANAHLIAAAPDLFAACHALVYGADLREAINMAGAALAKARGEG